MGVINFIIENILTQASITIALIAMLGLLLQKKSAGQVISGTLKTLLGFQVLSAGSSIIVGSLTYFGKIFTEGFHMQGIIPSIESINGQAMNDLGLGRDIALTFLAIFVFNIILARFTVHFSNWSSHFMDGDDGDGLWLFRRSARDRIDLSRWFYRSLFRHCYASSSATNYT